MVLRYSNDEVLHRINRDFITLDSDSSKDANSILHSLLKDELIAVMQEDALFDDLFRNIIYAGSYYKGTKVGEPDEYDLDLVMNLPLDYDLLKIETDTESYGYVKIKVPPGSKLPKWQAHANILNQWLDRGGYLDQEKFYSWMESVLTRSFSKFKSRTGFDIHLDCGGFFSRVIRLDNFRKAGPAFTLNIYLNGGRSMISIDIVPCLVFEGIFLKTYRYMPKFLGTEIPQRITVVAKPFRRKLIFDKPRRYWRLSFYEQEKIMLSRFGQMKPIIRYLKKFRDSEDWTNLPSYYIETVVLHEMFDNKTRNDFFEQSHLQLFFHMLQKLQFHLDNGYLPYFWNRNYNLLCNLSSTEMKRYSRRIHKVLSDIASKIHRDRFIIARIMLKPDEYKEFIRNNADVRRYNSDKQSEIISLPNFILCIILIWWIFFTDAFKNQLEP